MAVAIARAHRFQFSFCAFGSTHRIALFARQFIDTALWTAITSRLRGLRSWLRWFCVRRFRELARLFIARLRRRMFAILRRAVFLAVLRHRERFLRWRRRCGALGRWRIWIFGGWLTYCRIEFG